MQKRDHLFEVAKSNKDKDMWVEARQFRNTVNEACKYAKGDFIKETLEREQGNSSKFWEKLKPLYDTKSTEKNMTINLDGCTTDMQVADTFNAFFLTIGENLKKKIQPLHDSERTDLNNRENSSIDKDNDINCSNSFIQHDELQLKAKFKFRKTNTLELNHLVNKIQVHKASGVKRISSYLLKLCFKFSLEQLDHFN